MSLGIYPVFETELKSIKFNALGEVLASNSEELDEIARAAELTPFTAFADNRPIPDDFDGDPNDLAELMGEWTEWFEPGKGQVAMQALIDHIRSSPTVAESLEEPGRIIEELMEMTRVLSVAAEQGVRFRLEMS